MAQSYRRQPSLDNAYARVRRAKQHLARLGRQISIPRNSDLYRSIYEDIFAIARTPDDADIKTNVGKEVGGAVTYAGGNTTAPSTTSTVFADLAQIILHVTNLPPTIPIIVGECVYNLRAALDYLVYELAILDSGQIQNGTQFPIEDTPQGWNRRRKSYLKGLSVEHQAILESLQPYNGCQWMGTVKSISNPDKHRSLVVAKLDSIRILGKARTTDNTPPLLASDAMQMDIKAIFQVTFDDGSPVKETLQVIQLKVADVLDAFNSEFE